MYKKAISEINSLLKDYPNDPYFIELKAQILAENGKIKQAISLFNSGANLIDIGGESTRPGSKSINENLE